MAGALRRFDLLVVLAIGAWLGAAPAHALDGMWLAAPATNDFNTGTNWTSSPSVPDGTASFGLSTQTSITFSALATTVGTLQFNAAAPPYLFTLQLQPPGCFVCSPQSVTLNGNGIVNNSANKPTFTIFIGASLAFTNSASAGNANIVMREGALDFFNTSNAGNATVTMPDSMHAGFITFHNASSAANATITTTETNGAQITAELVFLDKSTAANATINNNPGTVLDPTVTNGGRTEFGLFGGTDTADAGSANITNNKDGSTNFFAHTSAMNATIVNNTFTSSTDFRDQSTAGNATITNNGGEVFLAEQATLGNATLTNNAGGLVQFGFGLGFGDTATAGNATIFNKAGGTVQFNDSTSAGSANIGNSGSITFLNSSTAANATITNAGMLNFIGSSTALDPTFRTPTAANATITNNAGGTLTFGAFSLTFPGGVALFNPFVGTGSAGNATIINNAGGSTTFFNQSTAGTATITNNAGGALFFANNGGSPIDPDASTARVINNAAGTVDISQVNAGVSIGSLSGAGNVFLGSKALTLGNLNSNDTIGGVIADGGTGGGSGGELIKIGTGNLTLTNTETYTGATMVDGGVLTVLGSIATSSGVTVNSGGTLAGTGTVATTVVNAGGTLAPGNGNVGTLTVSGNLTFNAGSIFLVDVTPTTSSKVTVNGTATINGGTVKAVFLPGSYLANAYTILAATGGRVGTFSNLVTVGLPAFLTASLAYDPNDVMLVTLRSNLNRPGLTQNQSAVAAALDNSFNTGHGTLNGLSFVAANQIPAALNALSGEGTSGTQETAFGAGNLFVSTMMEQGQFWLSGTGAAGTTYAPLGYAAEAAQAPAFKAMPLKAPLITEPVYRAWFAGFDGTWHLDGQAEPGSATLRQSTAGGAAGLDYQVNPNLLVGVAAGGSSSTFSVPDRATSGTLDGAHIGTYGVGRWGPWYAAGALAFNAFDSKYTRAIAGVGPTELAAGKFESNMLSGRFELGYRQIFSGFAVTPFAAVQFAELWQPGYSETSTTLAGAPGVLGLTYSAQTISSLPTFLGVQLDTRVTLPNGTVWLPYARLAWVHEFDPTRDVNAGFITLPVTNFTVFGPSAARDAAHVDLGSKLAISRQAALFASFEGEFSDRSQMYAGKGGLRVTW